MDHLVVHSFIEHLPKELPQSLVKLFKHYKRFLFGYFREEHLNTVQIHIDPGRFPPHFLVLNDVLDLDDFFLLKFDLLIRFLSNQDLTLKQV